MKLNELTLIQAHEKLKNGETTSVALTQACIERIKETDERLHTLLAVDFEEALKIAAQCDTEIKSSGLKSIVHGIPYTAKDILLTKNLESTAASNMLKGYVPLYDATVIAKLREAGAVLLGKNNLDAWAHGGSTENSDFGPSKNPWDLLRVPGGSSGGSASSVAADQCIFSIGSDTGGSIRQPASFCGVVGLKPSYGRVSRFGSIAMGSSLDVIGPITKSTLDSAEILKIIAGKDEKDGTTLYNSVSDYAKATAKNLKGIKIGVTNSILDLLPAEAKKVFIDSLNTLKNLGAEIVDVNLKYLDYGIATYYVIMPSEVSSNLGRYDGVRYGFRDPETKNIKETYFKSRSNGLGDEAKRRIMIGTYVLSAGYYDAYYKKAMKVRTLIKNEMEELFKNVDALAMPTTLGPAFKIGEKANDPLSLYLEDIFTVTANIAGVPAISIPSGLSDGLPLGLQLLANQFDEETLIKIASAFEAEKKFTKSLAL